MARANGKADETCINTLRFLACDAIEAARSGHPGLPLGAAAIVHTIWARHLRYDPADPTWPDRDRFVLSAGHGSALLYALLYLAGTGLSLDELKAFRQADSLTPGHPESHVTPGVEVTTGPLGQGWRMLLDSPSPKHTSLRPSTVSTVRSSIITPTFS